MDTQANISDGSTMNTDALAWTQMVCVDRIKQLLSARYLDITDVSRTIRIMNEFRRTINLPEHRGKESVDYHGLDMLHCPHFDKLAPDVRRGIPVALCQVLGLTEQEAPAVLAPNAGAP